MDLLRTIRILKLRNIKVLHIEPTDVCQAACPLCVRELDANFNKSKHTHLSMEQILSVFDQNRIRQLDKMFMCGNYGDPAAGANTLDIYKQFRQLNPSITLGMNSNGGLQKPEWWIKLAEILSQSQDYCVFSIDGLEDTNHVYRKNVVWHKLIENAKAFIEAGGRAHWDMLVYRHNEYQVNACEQLARDLGFKWFRAKISKRPLRDGLEMPVTWSKQKPKIGQIQCQALAESSLYIDAAGRVSPCCWLGARQQNFITSLDEVSATWLTDQPNAVCAETCTVNVYGTTFQNQWQREVELENFTHA